MELDDKKDHIIRFIKLGMDLDSSLYGAECSESEIEILKNDKDFLSRIKTYQSLEEYRLLEDHDMAMNIAAAKGGTAALQWKLAHLNPARWGVGDSDKGKGGTGSGVVIVLPNNGRE